MMQPTDQISTENKWNDKIMKCHEQNKGEEKISNSALNT